MAFSGFQAVTSIFKSARTGGTNGDGFKEKFFADDPDAPEDESNNESDSTGSSSGGTGGSAQPTSEENDNSSNSNESANDKTHNAADQRAAMQAAGATRDVLLNHTLAQEAARQNAAENGEELESGISPMDLDMQVDAGAVAAAPVVIVTAPVAPEKSIFEQRREAEEATIKAIEGSGRTGHLNAAQTQRVRTLTSDKLGGAITHEEGLVTAYEKTLHDPQIIKTIEQEAGLSKENSSPTLSPSLALVAEAAGHHGIIQGGMSVLWNNTVASISNAQTMNLSTPSIGAGAGRAAGINA